MRSLGGGKVVGKVYDVIWWLIDCFWVLKLFSILSEFRVLGVFLV